MFSEIFTSFKEFYKKPYGLLLLFLLLIPAVVVAQVVGDIQLVFSMYLSTASSMSGALLYILKNAILTVLIYIVFLIGGILLNALAFTLTMNYFINKTYEAKRPLTNGYGQIVGLYFAFYFFFLVYLIVSYFVAVYLGLIVYFAFMLLFLIFMLVVVVRWFFVPIIVIDKGRKISEAFRVSWEQTKGSYSSILFFIIIFAALYYLIIWWFSSATFVYDLTSNDFWLTIIDSAAFLIVDTVFMFWMIAVMLNAYER